MKTSVYAMKTNYGYGIWQETNGDYADPYSVVYTTQIKGLNELDKVFEGDYYFSRLIYDDFSKKKNKVQPYRSQDIIYLGEYELTKEDPKYARYLFVTSYRTWNHWWDIYDVKADRVAKCTKEEQLKNKNFVRNPNESLLHKRLTPESVEYPLYGVETIPTLRKNFDNKYHVRNYNDDYVAKLKEEYFKEKEKLQSKQDKSKC